MLQKSSFNFIKKINRPILNISLILLLKNTWKGIRNLINNNNSTASSIRLLTNNNDSLTDPIHVAHRPDNIGRRCHPEREKLEPCFLLAVPLLLMR